MKVAIGIATAGRSAIVSGLLDALAQQTRLPDHVFVCPAGDDDVETDAGANLPFPVSIVRGDRGLTAQRNTILRAASAADMIVFFDDDYLPQADFVGECEALFERDPSVVIVTGDVIADGINTPGISPADAKAILQADTTPDVENIRETFGGYGCNMAVRTAPMYANQVTFDEVLPLYGWLEDIDFSRRLAPFGRIVRTNRCRGVHMGAKQGRNSGVRFGYSQVANPIHMARKGSVPVRYAMVMISRNLAANIVKTFRAEPWVDRRGRLVGNMRAFRDLLRGDLDPRVILEFK